MLKTDRRKKHPGYACYRWVQVRWKNEKTHPRRRCIIAYLAHTKSHTPNPKPLLATGWHLCHRSGSHRSTATQLFEPVCAQLRATWPQSGNARIVSYQACHAGNVVCHSCRAPISDTLTRNARQWLPVCEVTHVFFSQCAMCCYTVNSKKVQLHASRCVFRDF